jgi:diguanylate cyclase (GGDEF)-like protein
MQVPPFRGGAATCVTGETMTDAPALDRVAPTVRAADPAGYVASDLRAVLCSIGEALYTWDLATDSLAWSAGAASALRLPALADVATGRAWARLVEQTSGEPRYDAVMRSVARDAGHGVAFQTRYAVRGAGDTVVWLEDTGRWFAGLDGNPARVHGVVRVVSAADGARIAAGQADPLTGALTRQQLADLLGDEIIRARRQNRTLGFALAGIENLAGINEAYGFDVADEVIAAIAQRLRRVMRRGDRLARYAGNRFGLVLDGCAEEQLPVAAQRFAEAVCAEPVATSGGLLSVRVRIGAVLLPRNGSTAAQAMQNAEEALTDAKAVAGPAWRIYSPDHRRDERRRGNRSVADEIVNALNDRRVGIARQPIMRAVTRDLAFEEALVRVTFADGSLAPAAKVIPVIEKLGLAPLVDHRVLELVAAALAADPAARLSMNVSGDTLCRPEWSDAIRARFALAPPVASRLIVEITETSLIGELAAARSAIRTMRDLGMRVAIDDFGAGHTSFRHLRDLGVDMVKIDGAFVQNVARSCDDRFFVRTLIDLARHLGLEVVAEWVEHEEVASQLEAWGVDYLQGALFGDAEPGSGLLMAAGRGAEG